VACATAPLELPALGAEESAGPSGLSESVACLERDLDIATVLLDLRGVVITVVRYTDKGREDATTK